MKALSLIQPWASLIAAGEKHYETRSWETSYRGPIAIHASGNRKIVQDGALQSFHEDGIGIMLDAKSMPWKAIVAIADLTDCQRTVDILPGRLSAKELLCGDFSRGRYGFRLERVIRLPDPVHVLGSLGIWEVPPEIAARVLEQLRPEMAAMYVGLAGAAR